MLLTRLCRMAVLSVVPLLLILAALIDIISRPEDQVRHLPKLVWVLLVVFLPLIGSLVWFAIGREYPARAGRSTVAAPEWQGASASGTGPGASRVRSTEDELAALEREIEFHQRQARIRASEAELAERRRLAEET